MRRPSNLSRTAASTGGTVLAAVFGAASRLRPTMKPLHPRGAVHSARLVRTGLAEASGVAWLDQAGTDDVTVRVSRAIGLPPPWPDIGGLAVRVPVQDQPSGTGCADLLLATTGLGTVSRFLLRPTTSGHQPHSTLLPYRSPRGPLLLAALPDADEDEYVLACATARGPWHRFGTLHLGPRVETAPALRFDPVLNPLPGLPPYDWVARLREGAYAAARRNS